MNEALAESLKTPPSRDEFERSLNGWKKLFFARLQEGLFKVQLLSGYAHMAGDPHFLAKDLGRYTSLTPEGVHASGQRWLNLQTSVRVDIEAEERRDDGKTTDEGGNKR